MVDKIEFEDDAPLELSDDVSIDDTITPDEVFASKVNFEVDKAVAKETRKTKMKDKPKPLRLTVGHPKKFKQKDFITIRCNICDKDMQHAKQDDDGHFEPYALCQHVVFKGVTEV